jgi:hypothetical protein
MIVSRNWLHAAYNSALASAVRSLGGNAARAVMFFVSSVTFIIASEKKSVVEVGNCWVLRWGGIGYVRH